MMPADFHELVIIHSVTASNSNRRQDGFEPSGTLEQLCSQTLSAPPPFSRACANWTSVSTGF